jgi:ABC-type proline/glycine betaine transport system substrate-binding protein
MLLTRRSTRFAAVLAAGSLSVGAVAAPAASAQPPLITGGLVNVTITDVDLLNNVVVTALNGVTLQVAAQVCGVSVNVLAADLGPDGFAVCDVDQDSDSTTTTTVTQRR